MKVYHAACGTLLILRLRVVVTLPEDRDWPRDIEVPVPYCITCKTVVSPYDVEEREG